MSEEGRERCETCRFWEDSGHRNDEEFDPKTADGEARIQHYLEHGCASREEAIDAINNDIASAREGTCRRFPPQMIVWPSASDGPPGGDSYCDARQPKTDRDDWCGEWQKKPSD